MDDGESEPEINETCCFTSTGGKGIIKTVDREGIEPSARRVGSQGATPSTAHFVVVEVRGRCGIVCQDVPPTAAFVLAP